MATKREIEKKWNSILVSNKEAIELGEKARLERESLILEADAEGMSKTAIHRATGISRTAIYNILNKHKKS